MDVYKTDVANTENISWSYTKLIRKQRDARKYIWTKRNKKKTVRSRCLSPLGPRLTLLILKAHEE